jgi:hypothetical protein
MVCKRNQCVDRGGGSPMTRTLAADAVMSACGRTASGRSAPALARPVSRGSCPSLGSYGFPEPYAFSESYASPGSCPSRGSYASRTSACVRCVSGPPVVRSCRLRPVRPPLIRQRSGLPRPCQLRPVHRLYLYLPQWHPATLLGCSFDPGRDVLCTLTSPRRWLQWP